MDDTQARNRTGRKAVNLEFDISRRYIRIATLPRLHGSEHTENQLSHAPTTCARHKIAAPLTSRKAARAVDTTSSGVMRVRRCWRARPAATVDLPDPAGPPTTTRRGTVGRVGAGSLTPAAASARQGGGGRRVDSCAHSLFFSSQADHTCTAATHAASNIAHSRTRPQTQVR